MDHFRHFSGAQPLELEQYEDEGKLWIQLAEHPLDKLLSVVPTNRDVPLRRQVFVQIHVVLQLTALLPPVARAREGNGSRAQKCPFTPRTNVAHALGGDQKGLLSDIGRNLGCGPQAANRSPNERVVPPEQVVEPSTDRPAAFGRATRR
jgi:hypothetical protein